MSTVKFLHGIKDKNTLKKIDLNGGVRVETYLLPDGTLVFLENESEEGLENSIREGKGNSDLKTKGREEEEITLCDSIIEEWRNSWKEMGEFTV